jgi:hypothetical protein
VLSQPGTIWTIHSPGSSSRVIRSDGLRDKPGDDDTVLAAMIDTATKRWLAMSEAADID